MCSPYDTLEEVIGTRGAAGVGSLADFGVNYAVVPLLHNGRIDMDALEAMVGDIKPRVALV